MNIPKIYKIIFCAVFFIGLIIPVGFMPVKTGFVFKDFSKRYLFREDLMKLNSLMKIALFNTSPANYVVLGKEGWLFLKPEAVMTTERYHGPECEIDDFRGMAPLSAAQTQRIKAYLSGATALLKSKQIPFYVLITPNKSMMYSEYLPDYITVVNPANRRVEQFKKICAEVGGIRVIDIRRAIADEKKQRQLYQKADTHWNYYGAYVGYRDLMKAIRERFPGVRPFSLDDFAVKKKAYDEKSPKGSDIAKIITLFDYFEKSIDVLTPGKPTRRDTVPSDYRIFNHYHNQYMKLQHYRTGIGGPSLLILHDSFFDYFPYISYNFKETYTLWDYRADEKIINRCKPDIVVIQVLERFIYLLAETDGEKGKN